MGTGVLGHGESHTEACTAKLDSSGKVACFETHKKRASDQLVLIEVQK